jgi:nitrogen fixation NifU-like protein
MSGLEDLYREIILDHYRTPRNRGELESPPAVESRGHNPLCGDEITLYLLVDGEGDEAVSMMTQAVMGKPVSEARALIRRFRSMMGVEGIESQPGDDDIDLGDLEALQGVVKFPVRIKCAVLGWNTLADALDRA